MKHHIAIGFLALARHSVGQVSNLCLTSPPVQLDAGVSNVTASVRNPLGLRCIATLTFTDADFLPVSYVFQSPRCPNEELESFTVPAEAPNGYAHITWQCAGKSPTCSRAIISGGVANSSLELQKKGDVVCIDQVLQTSTTLSTFTRGTSIIVETIRSVFTSTTTNSALVSRSSGEPAQPSGTSGTSTTVAVVLGAGVTSAPSISPATSGSSESALVPVARTTSENSSGAGEAVPKNTGTATETALANSAPPNDSNPLAFTSSNAGSAVRPSIIATTMISTITVIQTMTALASACISA